MADFEEQLNLLLEKAAAIYSPVDLGFLGNDNAASKWMNDVQIFYDKYLKEHPLGQRMKTLLFHRSENAVGDACTGSNPRTIDPATMERLFTCIYYGTEVDF